jgi:hypothetical protein
MNTFLFRLCPLLLVLAAINASAKDNSKPHIYSDVHLEEGGVSDLIGTELELKLEGSVATGVARIYQGRCAEPVKVTGSVSGTTVHVSGEGQGFGKIDITGKLEHGRLDGMLRLDRVHSKDKIRLKRISKPHC